MAYGYQGVLDVARLGEAEGLGNSERNDLLDQLGEFRSWSCLRIQIAQPQQRPNQANTSTSLDGSCHTARKEPRGPYAPLPGYKSSPGNFSKRCRSLLG